ncbi:DUF1775 domain-containing protein [Listeria booriae]|uniref:DUF1775 domain-containing protein n=1 Tax=Listeria booriae TaxID=1552123 RepID=A0A842AU88_9LIST|nr:DUF1775 domain-containing protein [Listeria booriae]MBC1795296.1 DUF1775 domain-containing protein [Listeria booriae]MBC1811120.1 DUF1775 domain-containing protein [Listeria booriae]MBC1887178.1 DUF1775 domain-containing protein [Listeria booriae]MBC2367247.1 DUF1775 domain-containing protein [Listeria booriae]
MRKVIASLMGILFLVAAPVVASAHVTVAPMESTTGAWETYTVKVPVEKDSATTKVVVKMPAGVAFQSYEPVPGWNVAVNKDNGTVTWTATGSGILNGQFQRFSFVAQNPEKSGTVNWDAYQYYADGSIVEWTGDASADYPHATTTISKAASESATDSHGKKAEPDANETAKDDSTSVIQWVTLGVSIVALLIAIWALVRKRKN